MGDLTITSSVAALVASLLALAISTILAARQSAIMKASNHLPVLLDFFREMRDKAFIAREFHVREEIRKYDASLGFSNLPEPIRSDASEVCFFYLSVTYMVRYGRVDEKVFEYIGARMVLTWNAVKEHVEAERMLRGNPKDEFLGSWQRFVERAQKRGRVYMDPTLLTTSEGRSSHTDV